MFLYLKDVQVAEAPATKASPLNLNFEQFRPPAQRANGISSQVGARYLPNCPSKSSPLRAVHEIRRKIREKEIFVGGQRALAAHNRKVSVHMHRRTKIYKHSRALTRITYTVGVRRWSVMAVVSFQRFTRNACAVEVEWRPAHTSFLVNKLENM